MNIAWILAPVSIAWATWRPLCAVFSRRFCRAYPGVSRRLRISFIATFVLIGIIGWLAPVSLWLVTAAALALGVVERWRARTCWGCKRGLPPGSLGIFPASWADDRFYLDLARMHGPIFKTSHFFRPTACVVGLQAGIRLLREHGEQLEAPYLPFSEFVPGGMLRYMREPQHRQYRSIFRSVLSLHVIRKFRTVFTDHIHRTLEQMGTSSLASPSGIHPRLHTDRLMLELWLELFFAIRPGSPESKQLLALYPSIDITNPTRASRRRVRQCVQAIREIVSHHAAGWKESPPCLLSAIRVENPANADDPVVIGNLIYMLTTTASDMSALLNWILKKASQHPHWMDRVAADHPSLGEEQPVTLAERFVLETLRMRQSEFIYRAVLRDINFAGFRIPRGWLLRICVWESHRDPAIFDEPDSFNPDRFLARTFARDEFSPFGASTHACLAPFLVTSVASTFVFELASAFRVSSPSGGPPVLASTRHWAPGPAFRIQLERRA